MKTKLILNLMLFAALVFFASCVKEGPAGAAGLDGADGADGKDGKDGNVTCLACHTSTALKNAQFQYAKSTHKAGTNVEYAGGRASCAACHSSEGFIEYHTTGTVAMDISMPSAITCETCHKLHTDFTFADYALRKSTPVTMRFDNTTVINLTGGANLCVNCHQSRTNEPNKVTPGATFRITSTHYGPHYGTQSNLLEGVGFALIPGAVEYPAVGSGKHRQNATCLTCHMGTSNGKEGGHTWHANLSACNTCHTTPANFDYNGNKTDYDAKLLQLQNLLVAKGIIAEDPLDPGHYVVVTGTYDMKLVQAFFNWKGLYYDHSHGAHNPAFARALLINSIAAAQ
jgi:hypothetical protein